MLDGSGSGGDRSGGDDPVETLRERFARGEIDQTEFERRLDALLASEAGDDRPLDGPSGTSPGRAVEREAARGGSPADDRPSAPGRDREPEST
ncbi:SHOCT domain-containing protein [Halosimplex rubrum]|uniref:SHOCT domain-containing protein n=2 Tax=Halosimplex rubrum TaxID=869889 RepID=A0A7D5P3B0_9EURY|nr:SHOCT domain-containing protein [Halosimplex rubrum]